MGSFETILRKAYLFTFIRGLRIWTTYKSQAVFTVLQWILPVFLYFFVASYLTSQISSSISAFGGSYIAFFVIGLAFQGYVSAMVASLSQRIRTEEEMGTLEHLMLSPTRPGAILLYTLLWPILLNSIEAAMVLSIGAYLLGVHLHVNAFATALAILLILASNGGIGMMAAAYTLFAKQGNPISLFFSTFSIFISGVVFPVTILPPSIRVIAYALPLTYGLEALRYTMLDGATIQSIMPLIEYLGAACAVTIPLGLYLFRRAFNFVRNEGTLSGY
ncbi:MAG: ABC transporter permease [Candidatus Thermoplasmatota archaeon]|nr:ABC transporter permease [Candidatus Thermoplasmatota archaeon]